MPSVSDLKLENAVVRKLEGKPAVVSTQPLPTMKETATYKCNCGTLFTVLPAVHITQSGMCFKCARKVASEKTTEKLKGRCFLTEKQQKKAIDYSETKKSMRAAAKKFHCQNAYTVLQNLIDEIETQDTKRFLELSWTAGRNPPIY
jgi:hypothetical protein